jgi:hypothetical protein
MPYIKQEERTFLDQNINPHLNLTPGALNYCITRLINLYLTYHGKGYSVINEVIGVLECAKLELYRRIASPYEDKKKEENGDVYTV